MQQLVQPDGILSLDAARELSIEIESIEAQHGPNPYANYLRKHGKRPPKAEAVAIGRLMGARVQADDGSMQPRQTVAERKAQRARQEAFARRYERAERVKAAIAGIAELPDATDIIGEFVVPAMVANVDLAVCSLERFAGQVHGWKQIENAANSNAYCRSNEQGHAQRRDSSSTHGDGQERQSEGHRGGE